MNAMTWFIFLAAALLEVAGDAVVRRGLRGRGMLFVGAGMLMLGGYGLAVNSVRWDFSKLLGVYVGFFALISVLVGRIAFKESIPLSTWVGLVLVLAGGMVIQFGQR